MNLTVDSFLCEKSVDVMVVLDFSAGKRNLLAELTNRDAKLAEKRSLSDNLSLTKDDVKLAVIIGIAGYLFNSRTWLLFLNRLNPIEGTIVYYVIIYVGLYGLAKLGLSLFGFTISTAAQTFGLLMLNFAFHVTTNWASPWVQYVTTGSLVGMSNVLVNNSEDGLVWYVVYALGGITNLFWARVLTFTVIPFLISMVALYLIKGKPVLVP